MDEGRRAPLSSALRPRHDYTIEAELQSSIGLQGPALLYAPEELRRSLEQRCPDAESDIALLLIALEEQVPQALLGVYGDDEMDALTTRLENQLYDRRDLDWHSATWAVNTWARALHVGMAMAPKTVDGPRRRRADYPGFLDTIPNFGAADGLRHDDAVGNEPSPATSEAPPASSIEPIAPPPIAGVQAAPPWILRPRHAIVGVALALLVGVVVNRGLPPSGQDTTPAIDGPVAPAPEPVAAQPVPEATARTVSAPAIVTVPARGPELLDVDAPTIAAGKPFDVTLDFHDGASRVAFVERRVVNGDLGFDDPIVTTRASDLPSAKDGGLRYPFEAIGAASHGTVAFTLIDFNGTRSASRTVALDVPAALPAAAPTATAAEPCTRETCGSVVAIRDVDAAIAGVDRAAKDRSPARYDIVVRLDDRSVETVTQPNRWKVGARVQKSGAGFVALGGRPATRSVATATSPAPAREGKLLPESAPIVSP